MPIYWNEANPTATQAVAEHNLLNTIEYGSSNDGTLKHALNVNLGYTGTALPVLATPGYALYGNEIVQPPIFAQNFSERIAFQRTGCRPRMRSRATARAGTWYINRFVDGQVWLSSKMNSATGTCISYASTSTLFPRGVRYLYALVIGGGGGGGCAGTMTSAGGGGGGGSICALIKLPETGYVIVSIGAGGSGGSGSGSNDGSSGEISTLTNGSFVLKAFGGVGGSSGTNGSISVSGGNATHYPASPTEGILVSSLGAHGGTGRARRTVGDSCKYSFAELSPEATAISWSKSGGYSQDSAGRGGGGGASCMGNGGDGGNAGPGSAGGIGAGGGGGGNQVFNYHSGGKGGDGMVEIFY